MKTLILKVILGALNKEEMFKKVAYSETYTSET